MRRRGRAVFWGLFGLAVVAVVAGILLGARSMRAYRDPSTGMEPAIRPGDRLSVLVSQNVRRGDIIVFTRPGLDVAYVKRVIGLPGDDVRCCNGRVSAFQQGCGRSSSPPLSRSSERWRWSDFTRP